MKTATLKLLSFIVTLAFAAGAPAHAVETAAGQREAQTPSSWSSPSLRSETVVGPNGAVTTDTALSVNARMGITDSKVAERVAPGVYALRGWGIASSFAIEAADG